MAKISKVIRKRIEDAGARYWSNDNISEFMNEEEKWELIDELTEKFEGVLDSLLIDRYNDPNAMDTGRRMAKMYVNEIMGGRYAPPPKAVSYTHLTLPTKRIV